MAVFVHLQDVNVVGEPVEQGAGRAFGAEDLRPFLEGQVACDQCQCAFVALAESFEVQFGADFGERHEIQFVDDQQFLAGQQLMKALHLFFIARLDQFVDQRGWRW